MCNVKWWSVQIRLRTLLLKWFKEFGCLISSRKIDLSSGGWWSREFFFCIFQIVKFSCPFNTESVIGRSKLFLILSILSHKFFNISLSFYCHLLLSLLILLLLLFLITTIFFQYLFPKFPNSSHGNWKFKAKNEI